MPKLTKRRIDAFVCDRAEAFLWDSEVKGFGVRFRSSGLRTFIVKYRMGSSVRRHTLGPIGSPHTVEEAREAAVELLRSVKAGEDPMKAKRAYNAAITVDQLIEAYLHEGRISKPDKRESSWRSDASVLKRHVSPLLGHRLARDLCRRDLEKLQADVLTGKTAKVEKTRLRGMAIIRGGPGAAGTTIRSTAAMLAWAVVQEIIPFNPSIGVKKIATRRRERFLTTVEAQHLIDTLTELVDAGEIPDSHAAIIRLLLFTGARKSEILNLTWGEVDLERGRIMLPWHRSKTGEKMIPLNSAALAEIMARPRASPYVFPAARGEGPTVGLYKTWDQVREVTKLQGVRLHDLRHSFASFAAADGASLYLIGKALGHRQATTTERYAHLTDDPIKAVAEQVASRFRLPVPRGPHP
jgi:integrase